MQQEGQGHHNLLKKQKIPTKAKGSAEVESRKIRGDDEGVPV